MSGCQGVAVIERAARGYAASTRQASDRTTRESAGYRTYHRWSRAYDVCGQSWTYVMKREVGWAKTLPYDDDDALTNLATTEADLPRAQDEVFDVRQSSKRRLANRLLMTGTRFNPASCAP